MASRFDTIRRGIAAQPAPTRSGRAYPLHIHIVTLFVLLVVAVGGVITWYNHVEDRKLIVSASQELIQAIGGRAASDLASIGKPVELALDLLARERLGGAASLGERMDSVPMLADALERNPSLSALYVGYGNGDFFLLRPLRDNAMLRGRFNPPAHAAYVAQSIDHDRSGSIRGTYLFLDEQRRLLERRGADEYVFDPRTRGWYRQALAATAQIRTAPYVFFTTGETGLTYARQSHVGAGAVLGADLTLRDLSRTLQRHRLTPTSELVLFMEDGSTLAYDRPEQMQLDAADRTSTRLVNVSDLGSPALASMIERLDPAAPITRLALDVAGRKWDGTITRLPTDGGQRPVYLAAVSPQDELFVEARRISRDTLLIALAIMLASIPVAWLLSRLLTTPLRSLSREARAVREFDFASPTADTIGRCGSRRAGAVDGCDARHDPQLPRDRGSRVGRAKLPAAARPHIERDDRSGGERRGNDLPVRRRTSNARIGCGQTARRCPLRASEGRRRREARRAPRLSRRCGSENGRGTARREVPGSRAPRRIGGQRTGCSRLRSHRSAAHQSAAGRYSASSAF
jgi:hypothetical protein